MDRVDLRDLLREAVPTQAIDRGATQRIRDRVEAGIAARRRGRMALGVLSVAAILGCALIPAGDPGSSSAGPTARPRPAIALDQVTDLRVEGGSLVVVQDDPRGTVLRLEAGVLTARVGPRPDRPLIIDAGSARVEVIGTAFTVARQGAEVRVEVEEGRVRVTGADGVFELGPGQSWRSPAPAPAAPPPAPPAPPAGAPGYRDARALEDSGEAEAAVAAYRAVAAAGGPYAEDARYAIVRVLRVAGDRHGAREAAREYLDRYPRGRYRDVLR
jgi:ferric-dicitrate binding protein FerR (iron transport regulator)